MITAILVVSVLALFGMGILLLYNFIDKVEAEKIRERYYELNTKRETYKERADMHAQNEKNAITKYETDMHALFGNYLTMEITSDPITKTTCVICTYKNGDTIKWEINGKKITPRKRG